MAGQHGVIARRQLVELGFGIEPQRRLERAFEEAERRRLLDMRALDELCERSKGRHGLKPMRTVLLRCSSSVADARSELEKRFVELLREAGLPMPAMNVSVEVDAHWPGTTLIVELDSYRHHSPQSAFERDRERDVVLKLAGYEVLRLTYRMVTDSPADVAKIIRRLLAD